MFGNEVVLENVVRGFLLFDLFLDQVLATTSGMGRVESDLPGRAGESNRPFNKPNTFRIREDSVYMIIFMLDRICPDSATT